MEIDRDTEFIILAGIRYAMGRRSYAPWLVCSWIKAHWEEFPEGLKFLICRDVTEEVDRAQRLGTPLGDDCDQKIWENLADFLNKNRRLS